MMSKIKDKVRIQDIKTPLSKSTSLESESVLSENDPKEFTLTRK